VPESSPKKGSLSSFSAIYHRNISNPKIAEILIRRVSPKKRSRLLRYLSSPCHHFSSFSVPPPSLRRQRLSSRNKWYPTDLPAHDTEVDEAMLLALPTTPSGDLYVEDWPRFVRSVVVATC
jgi:hypothetical protein